MCAFLFDAEFKEILFKLFILPSYEYCSTLNQTDSNRLIKSFSNNAKNINCNYQMYLSKQINFLKSINILPFKLRFLKKLY